MRKCDAIVVGSGPGGYVAALRLSQLGRRVLLVERENLGGVCLNWGCIPTKALLQSAHVCDAVREAAHFGVEAEHVTLHFDRVVARSREVAAQMSKGVQFLLNRANVEVLAGQGRLVKGEGGRADVEVLLEDGSRELCRAESIILATGARAREFPFLPIDGERVLGYREALTLAHLPASLVVVGSGAIGSELAQFYRSMGAEVTVVEALPALLPLEDEEVSKAVARAFRKAKIKALVEAQVERVELGAEGCRVHVKTKKGVEILEAERVLSAVGITPNVEGLGLEALGVEMERGRIRVDAHYRTNVPGLYAIGDVIPTVALAHVASAEAVHAAEFIAGKDPHPVDYNSIPACTFITPEVASVGRREQALRAEGVPYIVGTFPFTASGRATAQGARDGFVKLLFHAEDHRLLGAHIVGTAASEMIGELAVALRMGARAEDIHETMHAHPTLCEGVMEAAAVALGCAVHV